MLPRRALASSSAVESFSEAGRTVLGRSAGRLGVDGKPVLMPAPRGASLANICSSEDCIDSRADSAVLRAAGRLVTGGTTAGSGRDPSCAVGRAEAGIAKADSEKRTRRSLIFMLKV